MSDMRIREVPNEIHYQFKLICVRKRVTMNDHLLQLVKSEVERDKKTRRKKK